MSGTTWTQAICPMLVFGDADHGVHPSLSSPWVDAQWKDILSDKDVSAFDARLAELATSEKAQWLLNGSA